ncbi:MAG: hypothetical protein ACLVIR_11360 [Clostridium sp.]
MNRLKGAIFMTANFPVSVIIMMMKLQSNGLRSAVESMNLNIRVLELPKRVGS